jgi:hypothetical protein
MIDPSFDKPVVAGSSPASPISDSHGCFLKEGEHPCELPGLHSVRLEESNEAYHSDREYDSKSVIGTFGKSPLLYEEQFVTRTHTPQATDALQYGTLVHLAMEMGEEVFLHRATLPPAQFITGGGAISTKPDAIKWQKDLPLGCFPISPSDLASIKKTFAQLKANAATRELWKSVVHHEVSIRWMREGGAKLRCRPDAITRDGRIIDWKTTRESSPTEHWWRAVRDYDYALQNAIYAEGGQVAGLPDLPMVFVLISTVGSHTVHAVTLPDRLVRNAAIRLDRLLEELALRREMNSFYPDDYGHITELNVPSYLFDN